MRPKVLLKEPEEKPSKAVALSNYLTGEVLYDTLYSTVDKEMFCSPSVCRGSHIKQWEVKNEHQDLCSIKMLKRSEKFLRTFYKDHKRNKEFLSRWEVVMDEMTSTGTYNLTFEELEYGCKLAWRNAARCSARIQWQNLTVIDKRGIDNTDDMFKAICEHVDYATNSGTINPTATIFRQRQHDKCDLRVWNGMLFSYAGYEAEGQPDFEDDGDEPKVKRIGDQGNLEFTKFCQRLGWKGKGGPFDILPLILSDDGTPKMYEIPKEKILSVPIKHPTIGGINSLGLEWVALPMVAGMMFEIGGLQFPAAPFNGWFTSVEIATRDLTEDGRFGLLKDIGKAMELDTTTNTSLWKDRVALEMNLAVIYSFNKDGVTIVDQHTVSEQFQEHYRNEIRERGGCPADWVWLTPSQSGSLTPLYHQEMLHYHLSPAVERQDVLWQTYRFPEDGPKRLFTLKAIGLALKFLVSLYHTKMKKRPLVSIFYATETGTAKRMAEKLRSMFSRTFNVQLSPIEGFKQRHFHGLNFFLASTFGNGDPPMMAERVASWLDKKLSLQEEDDLDTIQPLKKIEKNEQKPLTRSVSSIRRKGSVLRRHNLAIVDKKYPKADQVMKPHRFGVFALGSSAYPHFCGFGKWLDLVLHELGGSRLLQVGLGDELGDREGVFQEWAKRAFKEACLDFGIKGDEVSTSGSPNEIPTRWRKVKNPPETLPGETRMGRIAKQLSKHFQKDIRASLLKEKKWLCNDDNQKNILLTLEMPNNDGSCTYEPGDHAAVFPVHTDEEVNTIMDCLTGVPRNQDMVVQLQEYHQNLGWDAVSCGLPCSTVRDVFKYHLSLRHTPCRELLHYLSTRAGDPNEAARLEALSENFEAIETWMLDEPTVVDIFKTHPSLRVESAELAFRLPPIQPRFYSIASSRRYCNLDKDKKLMFDLLLTVVEYETNGPKKVKKKGFCSNLLAYAPIGTEVAVYLRSTPSFHYDSNSKLPAILIGAGSGIAPFRGFWQEELLDGVCSDESSTLAQKIKNYEKVTALNGDSELRVLQQKSHKDSKISLFFGCWNDVGNLLINETDPLTNILNRSNAFSRKHGQKKEYVQDIIKRKSKLIYDNLVTKGGKVYVCGKVAMADAVDKAIVSAIEHHMTDCELELSSGADIVSEMKDTGRYNQDIFGT